VFKKFGGLGDENKKKKKIIGTGKKNNRCPVLQIKIGSER
jgi:hypothetical protein